MSKFTVEIRTDTDCFQPRGGEPANYRRDRVLAAALIDLGSRIAFGESGESQLGYKTDHTGRAYILITNAAGDIIGHADINPKG